MAQGEGDVDEHDDVGHSHGGDVPVRLSVQLVLNTSLAGEGDVHVGRHLILHPVLHELHELLLPGHGPGQPLHVLLQGAVGVVIINDDLHHDGLRLLVLRDIREG